MPCCAIGGTSQQAPVTNQIGSLTGASVPSGATDASWAQPVTLTAALLPRSTAPLGQIPPLLRTSLLRI